VVGADERGDLRDLLPAQAQHGDRKGLVRAGAGVPEVERHGGLSVRTGRKVDNVDFALARAEELGGSRTLDPVSLPDARRMAVFTDPDGNTVGLLSP
jgi:predicted enzyme related to lactoylglutathione lyase